MSLPVYPPEDLNRGLQLLQQLGSFWLNIFDDRETLRANLRASAHEQAQVHLNFLEAVACVSRLNVPVFHTENWHLLVIKLSDVLAVPSAYQPDDLVYGEQDGSVFGRPSGFIQNYGGMDKPGIIQAPLPAGLEDIPFNLQNLVISPSKVWINGLDFKINHDRRLLVFTEDPFKSSLVPHRDVFDSAGNKVDEEIALWVYKGQFDLQHIYIHFGYALGLQLASAQGYKDLLNAIWDMHVLGPSIEDLRLFLAALSGAPTVIDTEETVLVVRVEETERLVVTNTHVYRVPLEANLLVSEGDVLVHGDPVSDAVIVRELSGHVPDYTDIPAVALSRNFLSGGYFSELTFKNNRVALEYLGADQDGKTVVRFEVSGFPGDVEKFWDDVHTRGKIDGETLANLLDTRENPVGEPGPLNLPAMVNPLEFVMENLLRNNLFVINVRQASFHKGAPGVKLFRLLRDVIPPHTTYLVFIELTPDDEVVDLSQPGGEDEPGVEEEVDVFLGVSTEDEAFEISSAPPGTASYGDMAVTAKLVSLTCQ
jgi:hypothetical protein